MAIKDTSRKPYIEDNNTDIRIGIDLPNRKGNSIDGYFASTSTTIEAVKNNIRNLLNTNQGERLMQPNIGINLRKYLFNQITSGTLAQIQEDILSVFRKWLPFVEVRNIELKSNDSFNMISINIVFNIKQDPDTLDSVQIAVTEDVSEQTGEVSTAGGGGY